MFDSSNPTYPVFPILAFVGAAIALIPLPWHLQAWNAGTCLFMVWTAVTCLNLAINAIVWSDNVINSAPVWCDISSRITVAAGVALPAASLCIQRRLYNIATIKSVSISYIEKRRGVFIDLAIGLGIPLVQVVFQYIVSGHRFDIYEGIGCAPFTYNTPLAYPFSLLWPMIIALISGCYCVLTLVAFLRRRAQFNAYLTSNTSLTANRYFRLMGIASLEIICTIPISAYGLYLNVMAGPVYPWISWEDTHFNYSKVNQYPAVLWRTDRNAVISFELSRWLAPFCAFVFFAFFGFAQEARANYYKAFVCICGYLPSCSCVSSRSSKHGINIEKSPKSNAWNNVGTLPVYVARPVGTSMPPSCSFTSEDTHTWSHSYYERFPDTPSTPPSMKTETTHDGHQGSVRPTFASPLDPLPPYNFAQPPPIHTTMSSTFTLSSPTEKESPFASYRGLASTASLAASCSTPSSPTPIYDQFRRRTFDGPISVVEIPPVPSFPHTPTLPLTRRASMPVSPMSPLSPTEPTSSPTDSMFSHESDQSAVSLSLTDIEAAYGARVPSFVSLEVEHSSAPPTPFVLQHNMQLA